MHELPHTVPPSPPPPLFQGCDIPKAVDVAIVLDTSTSLWDATSPPSLSAWNDCVAFADTLVDMIHAQADDARIGVITFDDDAKSVTSGYSNDATAVKAAVANYEYLPGAPDGDTRYVYIDVCFVASLPIRGLCIYMRRCDAKNICLIAQRLPISL